eukprot:s1680_g14.t1
MDLPESDDEGPVFQLPPKPPARGADHKRKKVKGASKANAKTKRSVLPVHQKAQSSASSSSQRLAAQSVELPPDDDLDNMMDELFLMRGNGLQRPIQVPDPDTHAQDFNNLELLTYDSERLKLAAAKIPSQIYMPYADLLETMQHTPPVDPNLQCTLWEIYSVPRLGPVVRSLGGSCRRSYDLKNFWDLKQEGFQRTLLSDVSILQPRALVLSPPCTWVSMLMHSNWNRVGSLKRVLNLLEACGHIDFSMWLAAHQHEMNRLFVFEHPAGSLAWERDSAS